MITCPGCGARFFAGSAVLGGHDHYDTSPECWHAYGRLTSFIAEHPEELAVWQQTAVDAFTLQHLRDSMPAIKQAFALNGLFMVFELGFTGLQARAAHGHLAETVRTWPTYERRDDVGDMTASDVSISSVDHCADDMASWGRTVWDAWGDVHDEVADATDRQLSGWLPPAR